MKYRIIYIVGTIFNGMQLLKNKILNKLDNTLSFRVSYYLKGGGWILSANIAATLSALGLSIAFARLTTKEFYGKYKFILSIVSLISILSLPGMETAIVQSVARGYHSSFHRGTKERLIWSLLGSAALVGFSAFFYFSSRFTLGSSLLLVALFFPTIYALKTVDSFYTAKKLFREKSKYQLLSTLVPVIGTCAVLLSIKNLFYVFLSYGITNMLVNLYFYHKIPKNQDHKDDNDLASYGKKLSFINAFSKVSQLDKLVIAYFLGFDQVAIYSIALSLSEGSKILYKLVKPLTLPKFSTIDQEKIYEKLKPRIPLLLLLGSVFAIAAIFLTPYAIKLLYSTKYSESTLYAQILFTSLIIGFLTRIFSTVLESQKRKKELFMQHLTYSMLLLSSLAILTPMYGVLGVAIAFLVTRFGTLIYKWYAVSKM